MKIKEARPLLHHQLLQFSNSLFVFSCNIAPICLRYSFEEQLRIKTIKKNYFEAKKKVTIFYENKILKRENEKKTVNTKIIVRKKELIR